LWDSDTLGQEKRGSPELAAVILGKAAQPPDPRPLHERITNLKAAPREEDPAWWNDLAGAHVRLGNPAEAVRLLEPLLAKFPNDYGVHANLGTAYHLLGRYADAERHIARDLEINPDAHFGLERYHLALLQYLIRDEAYRKAHLFVDEFSYRLAGQWSRFAFFQPMHRGPLADGEVDEAFPDTKPPAYRHKWNLAEDPKFTEGILYLASLNPEEPACFVMLGIACLRKPNADLNLASAAFKRAIKLGSPQSAVLEKWVADIDGHISQARKYNRFGMEFWLHISVGAALAALLIKSIRLWRARQSASLPTINQT
jgi:tetratricopeptide (TPR) repeat protein